MNILRRGRLQVAPDEDIMRFTSSMEADKRIFDADIQVDKAHVVMLKEQDIIKENECCAILSGLDRIQKEGISALDTSYEDVHIALEARLIEMVGEDTGGRMHSGRSRNDEVATCIRLTLRTELLFLMEEAKDLVGTLIKTAGKHHETIMPGYTHTQHAQPTTLSHNLLAHANAILRDIERIKAAYKNTNQNPLGAAAFASTGFPINRKKTTELLGFDSAIENSMDAVSTRDFMIESISCFSNMMTNLGRMAEELILWSSSEFGFIELDDSYSSTSSIMPQKKNPDIAELMRAKAGTVNGALVSVLTICKALPYSYNRDLQEATPHLWRALDTVRASVRMARGMIGTMSVKKNAMITATNTGFMTATELADVIVRTTGIPFRTAHHIVGAIAKTGLTPTLSMLDELSSEIIHEKLSDRGLTEKAIRDALDPVDNVRKRKVMGGPSPLETKRQIAVINKKMIIIEKDIGLFNKKINEASDKLAKACKKCA
ncbi:MAG: argininosuccinate lyase [Candidatus Methanoperedens nitroreducens]|uniref:Argininosuccinate lyase n=1 Tax=Candidatus Methanoperedens nitratireducens TaxID=1392998 RepID=A0A0P8A0M7_9EURY|nr:argininosuccinate lyase [Candidatus Methanoperedens sp. BLZ2]KAB2941145.1 MAG: argininosuccinate lyase [Candidatus Methanoperedens sp.]KPQ41513.1 MAG: argininosuccinate lyase [Candidatus Methanoperedens sp. BLZ1]MBZ0176425.1 argininosuccinate lyase [Candidatus Methanoperedens nitroreducens]MCX9079722.1 argininosuccinate lyase [Candidatus Methanoperedens sp.]